MLDDADPELRLTAAMLLTRRDGPLADRGRALCNAALESTDAVVVAAALSAVTQGPDASYVAALMALAARRTGSRSAIGAAVAAHVGLPGCDAAALQRLAVTGELDDEIRACARQARCLVGAAFGNQWLTRAVALAWQDAADPVLAETARWLRGELTRPSPPRVE